MVLNFIVDYLLLYYTNQFIVWLFFRGLLDDENFHTDVKALQEEAIPYFSQFERTDTQQSEVDSLDNEIKEAVIHSNQQVRSFNTLGNTFVESRL